MPSAKSIHDAFQRVIEERYGSASREAKAALDRAATLASVYMGGKAEWTFANMDELTSALERAFEESGADKVLAEFVAASRDFAHLAQTIPGVSLDGADAELLQTALQAKFTGWDKSVNEEAIGWLRDRMLTQTVQPVTAEQLASELTQFLEERVQQYADTYAEQALSDLARATWKVTGDKLEASEYTYMGAPPDGVIRPFCEERYGNTYTVAEIDGMDNGQGLSVWESGGGWRCRHQWVPVV